jgi:hypothetical protein
MFRWYRLVGMAIVMVLLAGLFQPAHLTLASPLVAVPSTDYYLITETTGTIFPGDTITGGAQGDDNQSGISNASCTLREALGLVNAGSPPLGACSQVATR